MLSHNNKNNQVQVSLNTEGTTPDIHKFEHDLKFRNLYLGVYYICDSFYTKSVHDFV